MVYKCQFPQCKYETNNRFQIHYHHIIPKECGGTNKEYNRIWLCPNHHSRIYIKEATKGIHSIKTKDSIIFKGILQSTSGRLIEYIENDDIKYKEL